MYNCRKSYTISKSADEGSGKSHLLETVFHLISKSFLYEGGNPDKPRVLVLAPAGVAAISITGDTIHFGLNIPCLGKLIPLINKNCAELVISK